MSLSRRETEREKKTMDDQISRDRNSQIKARMEVGIAWDGKEKAPF